MQLFHRPSAASRLSHCIHSPGHEPNESRGCSRDSIRVRAAALAASSCGSLLSYEEPAERKVSDAAAEGLCYHNEDLEEAKRRGNDALVNLTALDKFDVLVINPIFGSDSSRYIRTHWYQL